MPGGVGIQIPLVVGQLCGDSGEHQEIVIDLTGPFLRPHDGFVLPGGIIAEITHPDNPEFFDAEVGFQGIFIGNELFQIHVLRQFPDGIGFALQPHIITVLDRFRLAGSQAVVNFFLGLFIDRTVG